MKEETVKKILELNAEFYQTFARQFSETRMRLQPGVRKVMGSISETSSVLDLGCGNGEFAFTLEQQGFRGVYVGVDMAKVLLDIARERLGEDRRFVFVRANLADAEWEQVLPKQCFDFVLAFAVLHHLPSMHLRLKLLHRVHELLMPHGQFIHSNWQFLNNERLRKRIQSWEHISLSVNDVESGDYLLDWRHGGFGLRYVHFFREDELKSLAEQTGFRVVETFYSDGEGGNLGLYQVWEAI